jgi:hypothetical protein
MLAGRRTRRDQRMSQETTMEIEAVTTLGFYLRGLTPGQITAQRSQQ